MLDATHSTVQPQPQPQPTVLYQPVFQHPFGLHNYTLPAAYSPALHFVSPRNVNNEPFMTRDYTLVNNSTLICLLCLMRPSRMS